MIALQKSADNNKAGLMDDTYTSADKCNQIGKEWREKVRRIDNAVWDPPSNHRDPIDVLVDSEMWRLLDLLPIHHSRIIQSALASRCRCQ